MMNNEQKKALREQYEQIYTYIYTKPTLNIHQKYT